MSERPVRWLPVLAAMLLLQICSAFLNRFIPTLGPPIMAAAEFGEATLGYLAAAGTFSSILFFMIGTPLVLRFGSLRALQLGLLLSGLGAALVLWPSWLTVLLCSLAAGFGYGPSAPAGSDILRRYAPARHRNLIFSIRQAGVPIGGVIAGLTLPATYNLGGMEAAVALSILACLAVVVLVQPARAGVDAERDREQPLNLSTLLSLDNLFRPLAAAFGARDLRFFTQGAACLATGQGAWFAFLVTYLAQDLKLSLAAAGFVFAVMQAAGVGGRVFVGFLADRFGSAVMMLRVVALFSGLCSLAAAALQPGSPFWLLIAVALLAGLSVTSWNGVMIAEIARRAPEGKVSEHASGATILVFIGYIVGPAGFGLALALTGSFRVAFLLVGLVTAMGFALFGLGERAARDKPGGA